MALNNQLKNTSKNYDLKIKEWNVCEIKVWCFIQINADFSTKVLQWEKIQWQPDSEWKQSDLIFSRVGSSAPALYEPVYESIAEWAGQENCTDSGQIFHQNICQCVNQSLQSAEIVQQKLLLSLSENQAINLAEQLYEKEGCMKKARVYKSGK